ncbi:hypothetical protein BTO01_20310 [Vibrio jasicida]|uniref:GNAT family N-acetyltransferase n=1 Tax=Vibrio jasicida TaxID=766224 RepID=UPI000CF53609|nr:GNAT family N-acetyltransferase [Vibrio jasicida]PQJ59186.1 hypothetical protein BTO01_20310 [Vibrio jasicida]
MINLRKVRIKEYPTFCKCLVEYYSENISLDYNLPLNDSISLAKKELSDLLPNGLNTEGHNLLCIEAKIDNRTTQIGYFWYSSPTSNQSSFLYFFYINKEFRNLGYGKKAINQLEELLSSNDVNQLKLQVFHRNQQARRLYQESGFGILSYVLTKKIAKR